MKRIEILKAEKILSVFAEYGFQKTSMEQIAGASGVSRQAIYNKFSTKENCYNEAILAYLSYMYGRIFERLEERSDNPLNTLVDVFDILIGDAVDIVNRPNGAQLLKESLKLSKKSSEDWGIRLNARLADFLKKHDCVEENKAEITASMLVLSGKGLLLEEPTREGFVEDMKKIIENIIK